MQIRNQSKLPAEMIAEIEAAISEQENLADVVRIALYAIVDVRVDQRM